VSVNDGHTTTTTSGATLNWCRPSEAKRDKASGRRTALTVKVMTRFQTVKFSVGIAISEPSTSNDAINSSLVNSICAILIVFLLPLKRNTQ